MTDADILEEAAGKSPRRCAWCGHHVDGSAVLRLRPDRSGWDTIERTSHGICAACAASVFGVAINTQMEPGL